jgi:hypothetical protein
VESKWKNYHITTFPGQSLSKTGLTLEEAMDLSRDRQIEEEEDKTVSFIQENNDHGPPTSLVAVAGNSNVSGQPTSFLFCQEER